MDLMSKTAIVVIVLMAIIFLVFYLESNGAFGTQQITQSEATTLVYHDLQNSFQGAVINITNVTPSQYSGSWHIVAAVIQNATSPCPSYSVYSFDYPKYNFVYKTENIYTENCVIYENQNNQNNIIGSYPAAITKSYDSNITLVKNFVYKFGFSNVTVKAQYFKSLEYAGKPYTDVWRINYTSNQTNNTTSVLLYENNGTIIKAYNETV